MLRSLGSFRITSILSLIVLAALLASGGVAHAQNDAPIAFILLGPDGAVARVITPEAQCPDITIDGSARAMQVRAAPNQDFPVTVCDAPIPPSATSAAVLGRALKLPKAKPERVVLVGDSGCRLKGNTVQSCNDPAQWPLAQVAASAAAAKPDLVIHVGDYHYRESPCIVDKANCAGSPFGDNWAAWNADLFTPARPLLEAAPWIVVRGNHEDCARAGGGFFRLVDPRPLPSECPAFTPPYAINYLDPQVILLDDSAVNDFEVQPDQVAEYTQQFQQIKQMAQGTTWLLMHDPLYVFGHAGEKDGKEQLFIDQLTLQQATNNQLPPSVQLLIAGHVHLFEVLSFGQGRPPSLVVGNGGTLLDPSVTTPLAGQAIGGMKVAYGTNIAQFGFTTMERGADRWTLGVRNVNGGDMDRCLLAGGALLCGQATLPQGGGDFTGAAGVWLALALSGAALVCMGLALSVRGRSPRTVSE